MPPRKPLSSRAPPRQPAPRDRPAGSGQPPDLNEDDVEGQYATGADYPVADGAEEGTALGDDEFAPPTARYREGEDIYGEDDPFPEEDEETGTGAPPRGRRSDTHGMPRILEVTHIGTLRPEDEKTAVGRVAGAGVGATEDDGGLEDDEEVDDDNATRAGPPIHLQVVAGPDEGRKRRFRGVRMVIGRAAGCDFRLQDASVSRRHLELVLGDDGVLLRDLGSGNGTRVNDEKVAEHKLVDGDEIAIGKTRFRFVDELARLRKLKAEAEQAPDGPAGEEDGASAEASEEGAQSAADEGHPGAEAAPEPEPTQARARPVPSRKRGPDKRLVIGIAAGAAVLMLVLIIGVAVSGTGSAPPPTAAADARQAEVALKLQQARSALAKNRFAEAVGLLEEAERTLPGADTSRLLEGARKEAAAAKVLDDARELIFRKDFEGAHQMLAGFVPAVVIGDVARAQVARELEEAQTQDLAARASAALDEEDLERSEALYAELPRTAQAKLHGRLEALRTKVAEEAAAEARRQQSAAVQRQQTQAQLRKQQIDQALESVRRRFDGGEWRRAALECDRVIESNRGDKALRERALLLKRLIPQFGAALEDAQKKLRAGNVEGSAAPFRKARELHRQIGFPGGYAQEIDDQLARSAAAAAKAAMARNDLSSAARSYRTVLQLVPSDPQAKAGLAQIQKRAEDLYLEAYIIRDRDPRAASDKFRLVMDVLPPEHPTFAKAQAQLGALP